MVWTRLKPTCLTKIIAKSTSSLWHLRTHVTGVLVHTKAPCGKLAYAYVHFLQWPHDSNLTITLLLDTLIQYQKENTLPTTLYIQMDNTARENKNKYVLGFCCILVELRIFQKVLWKYWFLGALYIYPPNFIMWKYIQVQINFLPVDHTHEDIDQLFSKIGDEIRHSGCEWIPGTSKDTQWLRCVYQYCIYVLISITRLASKCLR